ncbi:MAG: hypothetical protein RIF33_06595 [Cyclobacteriaceae bacterium]
MKKLVVAAGIIVALFISINAQAQDKTDARQAVQRARIANGVASGEVTRPEAQRLRAEQRAIRRTETRVEADGVVTRREQRKLNKLQNQASRDIARQKNDAQTRR